jgi:hypothetical protein
MKQVAKVAGLGLGLLAGCAAPVGPSPAASGGVVASVAAAPETTAAPDTKGAPVAPITVTLQGQVVGSDGAAQAGVGVLRVALDPYLVPVVQTRTDAAGTFSLAGRGRPRARASGFSFSSPETRVFTKRSTPATRAGRSYPRSPDGSVPIATFTGALTVAPVVLCPSR